MCGIVGIVSQRLVEDREVLAVQRDTMCHRGPDDTGLWWSDDGRVGFAHRRLSIIDLSEGGRQPMVGSGGSTCIVFNGEIYNFRELRRELEGKGFTFRSSSDTEVILAGYEAWGTGCLSHLNGMFAFAIYDTQNKRAFLARDRAGEKPLFYRLSSPGSLTFASELKALMADPSFSPRLDLEALHCYLSFGYVPGDGCILSGVRKLPPGHAMTFDLETGVSHVWPYWELPVPPEEERSPGGEDEESLIDELESLLEDAVRRQLVADVPIGVLLSGGVDSSLTTAMAVRSTRRVKTFTIRFPGHGVHDETGHARLIADHFGTEHVELEAGASTVDLLPRLARQFDEPIVDSSMIPTYLVSNLVRQHCTVAVGGDGGDELFGGYQHHNRLLWLEDHVSSVPLPLRKICAAGASWVLPVGRKGRNWFQGLGTDLKDGVPLIASYFDRRARNSLLVSKTGGKVFRRDVAEEIRNSRLPREGNLLQRATRMDFQNYLPEDILVKVDRASMLNSLEVRAPWLDYRIIEFAFGKVPTYLKTGPSNRKILPKRLARRLLPAGFDLVRKQGFSIPLASWLKGKEWGAFFREVLLDPGQILFDRRYVEALFDGQAKGRSNSERLFGLVLFALWQRSYKIAF